MIPAARLQTGRGAVAGDVVRVGREGFWGRDDPGGRGGVFWQREYFDRFIRDDEHYRKAVEYIHNNPVKAGLVPQAEDWPYSSAGSAGFQPAREWSDRRSS